MKKYLVLVAIMVSLFTLSSCHTNSNPASDPSESSAVSSASIAQRSAEPDYTAAEQFLSEKNDHDLLSMLEYVRTTQLHPGNKIRRGFAAASELSSDDLYNFFLNVFESDISMPPCFQESDQNYHIPVQTVTDTLDRYFEGYHFNPTQVTLLDAYNAQENAFIQADVVGFGLGPSWLEITKKEAISSDMVQLKAIDYNKADDPESNEISASYTLVLKITQDGYRYVSCIMERAESSTNS